MNASSLSPRKRALATARCFSSKVFRVSSLRPGTSLHTPTRKLVMPDMAETTTAFFPSVPATILATLSIASGEPTLVPPNFITVSIVIISLCR